MLPIKKWDAVLTINRVNSIFALRRFVLLERWSDRANRAITRVPSGKRMIGVFMRLPAVSC